MGEHSETDAASVQRLPELPRDVLLTIFRHLDTTALGRAAQVCRAWRDEMEWNAAMLWRGLCTRAGLLCCAPGSRMRAAAWAVRSQVRRLRMTARHDSLAGVYRKHYFRYHGCIARGGSEEEQRAFLLRLLRRRM